MSKPSQRKVYDEARNLILNDPRFQGIAMPTQEEVRAFLAPNPRFQATFPVPEFPGRNHYGSRPLEILGADIHVKEKSALNVPENRIGKRLQTNALIIQDLSLIHI